MKQGKRKLRAVALAGALAVAATAIFVATGAGDDGDPPQIGERWGEPRIVPSEAVGPGAASSAGVSAEAAQRRIVLQVTYRSARVPIAVAPGAAAYAGPKCKRRETPLAGGFGSDFAGLAESLSVPDRKAWVTGVINLANGPINFDPLSVCAKFKR
jgi:hypothetical protein